jgi:murein DD-endopeptidase MepM/ murein hydrolase activator NlpD
MDAFAQNLAIGKRVNEGETIGYLGGSGKGAQSGLVPVHLHYEVHFNLNGVFVPIDPVVNGSLIDPQKDLTTIVRMQQVDITFKQSKQLPLSRLISETDSTNLPKGDPINDSTQNTNNKSDEK